MPSAICTLFENNYHYGLAALTNSLYREGFRGSIYAGYRGDPPSWASASERNLSLDWKDGRTLVVAENLQLHFLPVDTEYHLTNYKPDFTLKVWNSLAVNAKRMFYFDPDIVIVRPWELFEEWVSCGIALSEDINSPLYKEHPRRVAWRRYFDSRGIPLRFKNAMYVNGGFIGLSQENQSFLETWKNIQEALAPAIGGLNRSIFKPEYLASLLEVGGPFMPFAKTDQDALNAAVEACENKISFIGKEAMGFENGFIIMYHALGTPKPWEWRLFSQSLNGRPPRKVDLEFWRFMDGPIMAIPKRIIKRRKLAIKITNTIGMFYKKN